MTNVYSEKDSFSENLSKYILLFQEIKNNDFNDLFSWYVCTQLLEDSRQYVQNINGLLIPNNSKLELLLLDILNHKNNLERNLSKKNK